MFEAYTYERLLEDVLDGAPKDIDTRPGSIFYDAVSGILLKVAKLYTDLDLVFTLTQIDTAGGEYLDSRAGEYGITRLPATRAEYKFLFEGVEPSPGERFFADGIYFTLCTSDANELFLRAETAGTSGNDINSGTAAVPLNNLVGLTAATFGDIKTYGTDTEDDDSLRERVRGKIAGASENGNKQHYKTWCESIPGVGRARIEPLWNGPNTVRATLISPLGTPCTEDIVSAVQAYVDPAENGYTATVSGKTYIVGDGLGEGVANIGAHFTATAAEQSLISVACTVELAPNYTIEQARKQISTAVNQNLCELALNSEGATVVRLSAIGALIATLDAVIDYTTLTLNGTAANVAVDADSVPVLGEVSIVAAQ